MTPRTPYKVGELLLHLTDRDLRILEDLEQYRLLDTRLTIRVLHRLEEHSVVARVGRRIGGKGHGSSQTVWQLAAAGERLLRARRGESGRRRYVDPGAGFLAHTLDVARYAATLTEQARAHSFVEIDRDTEHLPAVLRKPGLYQRYWQSGAEQAKNDGLFPLVVWVTPDQQRADKIQRAIREDRALDARLFHATTAEPSLAVVAPYTSPNERGGSL